MVVVVMVVIVVFLRCCYAGSRNSTLIDVPIAVLPAGWSAQAKSKFGTAH
jgi:hypothetical protein